MGVTVQIGNDSRELTDVTESWIQDQIGRRKRDIQAVCVIINVKEAGADLRLTKPSLWQYWQWRTPAKSP